MKWLNCAVVVFLLSGFAATSPSSTAQSQSDFNLFVLKAVDKLNSTRRGGGYDIGSAFTRNLNYGPYCCVTANGPPKTMCVAAVSEIIIEAFNIYAAETGDRSIFDTLPITTWTKGNLTTLRANIFMYAGTGSRGTGHTLERFGLGKELKFEQLKAGDFINLNRASGSGHAVVFVGYLDSARNLTPVYDSRVVGFRYFSAQGKGKPDAGFAYRNGYFVGNCPSSAGEVPRDCEILRSNRPSLLNAGRMFIPSLWRYTEAVDSIRANTRSLFESRYPGLSSRAIDQLSAVELQREFDPVTEEPDFFDGITTD